MQSFHPPARSKYSSQYPVLKHYQFVLPFLQVKKFHAYTRQQVKLWFCIF
jgi:hypothetical protein